MMDFFGMMIDSQQGAPADFQGGLKIIIIEKIIIEIH